MQVCHAIANMDDRFIEAESPNNCDPQTSEVIVGVWIRSTRIPGVQALKMLEVTSVRQLRNQRVIPEKLKKSSRRHCQETHPKCSNDKGNPLK
uniref:Uncharacterized protein n=1 Tax=Trichuris muris TaxID=70415 RepID=A0A5S6QTI3_TRIMR